MSRRGTNSGQSVTDALCKFALSHVDSSQPDLKLDAGNSNFDAASGLTGRGHFVQSGGSNIRKHSVDNVSTANESGNDVVSNVCDRNFDTDSENCTRFFRRNSKDRNFIPFINDVSDEKDSDERNGTGGHLGEHMSGCSFDEMCKQTYRENAIFSHNSGQTESANDVKSCNSPSWVLSNPYLSNCLSGLCPEQHAESQLWKAVRDNPFNFDGWTNLIQYVENNGSLERGRSVFNAFLPLYPYCYVYWKKYSDMEYNNGNMERACQVLEKGVMSVPLSIDLWMAYINRYHQYMVENDVDAMNVRLIGKRALKAAGSQFNADILWESVIQMEMTHGNPESVLNVYKQLMHVPTRVHSKHWSAVLQLVHDYHPKSVLSASEYLEKQKECCIELNMPFKEETEKKDEGSCASHSDAKLIKAIRDKIIQELTKAHQVTENKIKTISKLEDKIKRPYFHVIPLEKRQVKAWREYLELETRESNDPRQVVLLYERCLVPCAQYEDFWISYTRFLESKLDKRDIVDTVARISLDPKNEESSSSKPINDKIDVKVNGISDKHKGQVVATVKKDGDKDGTDPASTFDNGNNSKGNVGSNVRAETAVSKGESVVAVSQQKTASSNEYRNLFVPVSEDDLLWCQAWEGDMCRAETVRAVYRRACLVHCPNKPNIRLQWAQFEEQTGCVQTARQLLSTVIESYSQAVRPRLQLVGLERRQGLMDSCSRQYDLAAAAAAGDQTLCSWWAMKHARFCFKIMNKPDKALSLLRTALKSDRSNLRLYDYILDICYQRRPVDIRGVGAVLTLALNNKDLTQQQRVTFMRKRVEFYEEFGTLQQLRHAEDCLSEGVEKLRSEEKADKKRSEQLDEEASVKAGKRKRKADKSAAVGGGGDYQAGEPAKPAAQLCPRCGWNVSEPYSSVQVPPLPVPADQQVGVALSFPDPTTPSVHTNSANATDNQDTNIAKRFKDDKGHSGDTPHELQPTMMYPPCYPSFSQFPAAFAPFVGPIMTQQQMAVTAIPPQLPPLQTPVQHPVSDIEETAKPPAVAPLTPCLNVPEWFVREGGDLRISESEEGWSMLRLWPNFLSEKGCLRLFESLRADVDWQQKEQPTPGGGTATLQRLVAWFGASEYSRDGCTLAANCNWPPALLDMLHRLSDLHDLNLNSCALSLFRDGSDCHPWHWEQHEALGPAPTLVLVSLGAARLLELRRRCDNHLLRFPLQPGSLLVMEGRLQCDWLHQIPVETACSGVRISLEFRTMYDL